MKKISLILFIFVLLTYNGMADTFFQIKHISSYHTGLFNQSAAEISAYDPATKHLFLVNAVSSNLVVLDLSNVNSPKLKGQIPLSTWGSMANSVAVYNGLVAVAVEAPTKTNNGRVVFFDANGNYLNNVQVGALPDMLTFSPNGRYIVVCNEGEPNDSYTIDPKGTVSIIDLINGVNNPIVTNVDFTSFDGQESLLRSQGIRIFGPNASASNDLEPEYATVDKDNKYAYITIQENNAVAKIYLANGAIVYLKPLGYKNHNLVGNEFDASDRDNRINIKNWPVLGMYQPDGIANFKFNNKTYLVTANEGDARDYPGFSEERRVSATNLDPVAFPNGTDLKRAENLGRLNVTSATGDANRDGLFEELYVFGTRSFSIWDENLSLVWDSGSEFENRLAQIYPTFFNTEHTSNSFDTRSDNKGPEPEDVIVAEIDGKLYAFIVLERTGGFFVYDITNPIAPSYVTYFNHRNFSAPFPSNPTKSQLEAIGDLGPESIKFIPANQSPNGQNLLVVANEISGSISIFQVITKPVINLKNTNVCKNTSTPMGVFSPYGQNITVVNGSGDYSYFWSPTSLFDNNLSSNPIYRFPSVPRLVTLFVKDNQTGLTAQNTVNVGINNAPTFSLPSLISYPKNKALNLNSLISNLFGESPFKFYWTYGSNGNPIPNPNEVYPNSGLNHYKLQIFDKNGCATNVRNLYVNVPLNKESANEIIEGSESGSILISLKSQIVKDYVEFDILSQNDGLFLDIYNLEGYLIMQKNVSKNIQNYKVDFSQLPNGVYFLNFSDINDNLSVKIVKQK